jgi:hypothetical protein
MDVRMNWWMGGERRRASATVQRIEASRLARNSFATIDIWALVEILCKWCFAQWITCIETFEFASQLPRLEGSPFAASSVKPIHICASIEMLWKSCGWQLYITWIAYISIRLEIAGNRGICICIEFIHNIPYSSISWKSVQMMLCWVHHLYQWCLNPPRNCSASKNLHLDRVHWEEWISIRIISNLMACRRRLTSITPLSIHIVIKSDVNPELGPSMYYGLLINRIRLIMHGGDLFKMNHLTSITGVVTINP